MGQLDGKTALVTGGSSGIGLAAAQRFAAEGAYVFITGRRQAQLDEAVAAIGPNAAGIPNDVTDLEDLDRLFATIAERGAGLDVVLANAGGGDWSSLADTTPEHLAGSFDRNVRGTLFTVQKSLPLLGDGSSIILIGSTAAVSGMTAFGAYGASKAAIRSFGRTWAAELADRGIRVNTLTPGPTETPGLRDLAPDPAQASGMLRQIADGLPMRRLGRPDEIANAALFLASGQSSFITGSEIFVDGGQVQI